MEGDLRTVPLDALLKQLAATENGLSTAEAATRLLKYGTNEIPEKKENPFLKFVSYFWGPIPWMIEAALVLSGIVSHWADFSIIFILLFANAAIGFFEEHQAGNAIAALKKKLAVKTLVRRDGALVTAEARTLVPGDVVRLRLGDIIPADARLLSGDPIEVDQSTLTGESLPVEKNNGDAVYSGSIVRRGEIEALVYGTGRHTYFGKTAELVEEVRGTSHFQRAVLKIGNYLIVLAVVLVLLILGVAVYRGDPFFTTLEFALVLLVAAIPVAMPTVLSVTMAVGARLLAKKEAIVSRLSSIEELAGIDVLCSDKTGTLTENKLTLGRVFALPGISTDEVITMGALAARKEDHNVIDEAVIAGLTNGNELDGYTVVHFQPFEPATKRSEASIRTADGKEFKTMMGAVQVVLSLSANANAVQTVVQKAVDEFAHRGYRSLGVAKTDEKGVWQFIGVLPLFDPPRPDAKETIAAARDIGVKVEMVTGDQLAIAKETARQLGMGQNIFDAGGLSSDTTASVDPETMRRIEQADGFAQVFPEQKFHIVDALQTHDHIVGMTGDGVNDAPALKKADAGIAVSGATDAARAAASIVLLTPGLSVIIDAIKESRRIFQRMTSYSIYRITETLRVLFFMTLSILVFNFYPVTAIMIVMLALLNDGAILSIAYDKVNYRNQPEKWRMKTVLGMSTVLGIIGVLATFTLFYLAERVFHLGQIEIQTLMYLKLSVAGHLTIFITRTRGPFWSKRPAWILFCAVVATQMIATFIAVYGIFMAPIGWGWAAFVWAYAFLWFLLNDRLKLFAYKLMHTPDVSVV